MGSDRMGKSGNCYTRANRCPTFLKTQTMLTRCWCEYTCSRSWQRSQKERRRTFEKSHAERFMLQKKNTFPLHPHESVNQFAWYTSWYGYPDVVCVMQILQ